MVYWNDTDLAVYGIIVENVPVITKGKKNIKTYEVEGRNGFVSVDAGTYQPFVVSVECHVNTNLFDIDTIKANLEGFGRVSFDGERYYTAIVNNAIEFSKSLMFRKFVIQFMCNPIAHSIDSISLGNPSTITTTGTATTYPTITIVGDGDVSITCNGSTFYLYDLDSTKTYTLDCENKVIVDGNGNNCASMMYGNFMELVAGANTISTTGTLTTFVVEYHNAWL